MTPRPVDVASVQAKLRSLDELLGALRLVGEPRAVDRPSRHHAGHAPPSPGYGDGWFP